MYMYLDVCRSLQDGPIRDKPLPLWSLGVWEFGAFAFGQNRTDFSLSTFDFRFSNIGLSMMMSRC